MAALFRVKALYEYTSPHEDDLTFDAGQVITVTEEEDDDWYGGEYTDANGAKQEGIFPRNFVEKIEPTAPPRPSRTRPKKDSSEPKPADAEPEVAPPASIAPEKAQVQEPEPEVEPEPVEPVEPKEKSPPPQPAAPVPAAAPTQPVETPVAAPAPVEKPKEPAAAAAAPPKSKVASPPPVSEKPSSNSFKDRIAAFNKPAAPPVAPFKPSGLSSGGGSSGGTGFIKKPFVAAPPSRNAYVPPPQQAPVSKVYRRDEDPEIKEREEENQEQAEKAGLAPAGETESGDEDQPKPTTLKERIALLQKQQQEQAARHADTAAKKEKPKKPAPRKPEPAPVAPEEAAEDEEEEEEEEPQPEPSAPPALPRRSTDDSARRSSTDDAGAREPPMPRRKSSKGHTLEAIHDGNEADMSGAGDTTEGQDDTTEREDDEPARQVPRPPIGMAQPPPQAAPQKQQEEAEDDDEEEEEDEDVDPEVKRKEELRARMAKMSGGMGFHGMFGMGPPGGAAPPKKKKAPKTESAPVEDEEEQPTSPGAAPPVPAMIPVPGMGGPPPPPRRSTDSTRSEEEREAEPTPMARVPPPPVPSRQPDYDDDEEDDETTPALTPAASATHPPPPVPGGRPAPPPVPAESRPPPPPPPGALQSPSEGSASGDEMSALKDKSLENVTAPPPQLPPMPVQTAHAPDLPIRSPTSPGGEEPPFGSPTETTSKRNSRPPPPIPGSAPAPPPASSRPPPPPPPGPGSVSRQSTADVQIPPIPVPARPPQAGEENESEATEYEGDYDTDIGSSVPHKDALKAHARDSSQEDNSFQSPTDAPSGVPPPIPQASAPKAVPPPVPSQPPPPTESKRRSVDVPRAAPPPPPTREPLSPSSEQGDYDPYNYTTTPGLSKKTPRIEEEAYFPDNQSQQSVAGRPAAQQMPSARSRQSLDVGRKSMNARRSMDAPRPTGESGFIADDIELAEQSGWWKQANQVPPVLQGRRDIFYECDESTTTNQGAKTEITREIWVLFQDYSQTILTVRYDPYDPTDVDVEQRHEPPPRPLRQDQMEDFYERFGRPISEAAASKKDSVVGDGTPQGLILELLRPHKDALPPVGTRAFGALVYSNMANASTSQNDAIRPGDIISIRNAKFQGKHGPMHAKYSVEVGKPDHVGVVAEWDGTKKKVRAWEQGRESKKVKVESFKLDDLRSGEVRIWRVMPRGWVGWNSQA